MTADEFAAQIEALIEAGRDRGLSNAAVPAELVTEAWPLREGLT
jgi:hypothetical protein